jgi:hypothetical protein
MHINRRVKEGVISPFILLNILADDFLIYVFNN